jgi:glycosyltransferase involved in cell wall biosynthesis
MKIRIVTDTWEPEVNGVVRTLHMTAQMLKEMGQDVGIIQPAGYRSIRFPLYREVRLALAAPRQVGRLLEGADAVHIATEGPLGWAAAIWLRRRGLPFTTSYHTDFPAYLWKYLRVPPRLSYQCLRCFHGWATAVMVATPSLERRLTALGFTRLKRWSRGVDPSLFRPAEMRPARRRPAALYVGRVAREKNIEAFLSIDRPMDRFVVGDGPLLSECKRKFPGAIYCGALHGHELARVYANADVLVFPSRTDTFGLVMLEALASGTPVAAFPVDAPRDLLAGHPEVGCIDENLSWAIHQCLTRCSREACRQFALEHTWQRCTLQFLNNLAPCPAAAPSDSRQTGVDHAPAA